VYVNVVLLTETSKYSRPIHDNGNDAAAAVALIDSSVDGIAGSATVLMVVAS